MNTAKLNKILVVIICLIVLWLGALALFNYRKIQRIMAKRQAGNTGIPETGSASPPPLTQTVKEDISHVITPGPVSPLPTLLPKLLAFSGTQATVASVTTTQTEGIRIQNIDMNNIDIMVEGPVSMPKTTLRQSEGKLIQFTKPGEYKISLANNPSVSSSVNVK